MDGTGARGNRSKKSPAPALRGSTGRSRRTAPEPDLAGMPSTDLAELVQELTEQMHGAAAELQFEVAARLRDEISDLKKELRQMVEATR